MSNSTSILKITTGLAGAMAIAGGTNAYGAVVNSTIPPDLTNTAGSTVNTTVNWDVNGDGIFDFTFQNRYPNTAAGSYGVVWQLNMNPFLNTQATNGVIGYQGTFVRYANALTFGAPIATGNAAFSTSAQVTLGSRYSYGPSGVFNYGGFAVQVTPGTQAYAGFRFNAADGSHNGWIQLSVNAGIIDFTRAAYDSVPGTAINAGTIAAAVPEPSTMAALAVGAVGVLGAVTKRRRRNASV